MLRGEALTGIDLQSILAACNRSLQIVSPAARNTVLIDITQVLLNQCPDRWESLASQDLQGGLPTGDGLFQIGLLVTCNAIAISTPQTALGFCPCFWKCFLCVNP